MPHARPAVRTSVVRSATDRAAYAHVLGRQRVWLEEQMGMPLPVLQPGALSEYADPIGEYATTGTIALLIRAAGEPAGIAALRPLQQDPSTMELKRVFVLTHCRGRGLGRRLVEDALDLARRSGARRVVLETHEGHMARAVAVYRAVGFEPAPSLGSVTAPDVVTLAIAP